jgi:hypothetical protein
LGVISLSHSHSEKYGFGPSSEMAVSDGEDGECSYPLGDFPPATLLNWALFGDASSGKNPVTITSYWLKSVTVTGVAGWPKSPTGSNNQVAS